MLSCLAQEPVIANATGLFFYVTLKNALNNVVQEHLKKNLWIKFHPNLYRLLASSASKINK